VAVFRRRFDYYRRRVLRIFGLRPRTNGAATVVMTLSISAAAGMLLAGALTVAMTLTVNAAGSLAGLSSESWTGFTTFTIIDVGT